MLQERISSFLSRAALISSVGLLIGALMLLARDQVGVWQDAYRLWTTVIERRPDTGLAYANLALALEQRGDYRDARAHAVRALQILPGSLAGHHALGIASLELDDAITAAEHLGIVLEMREHLQMPDASVYAAMGMALAKLNHPAEAERDYRTAMRLEPRNPSWGLALSVLMASQERYREARQVLEEMVRVAPDHPDVYLRLGWVQEQSGALREAIRTWEIGLQHAPGDVNLRTQLAWVLATAADDSARDGNRARELAASAVRDSSRQSLRAVEALAAAYAELGHFEEAIATLKEAPVKSERVIDRDNAARLGQEIEQYRKRQPIRE